MMPRPVFGRPVGPRPGRPLWQGRHRPFRRLDPLQGRARSSNRPVLPQFAPSENQRRAGAAIAAGRDLACRHPPLLSVPGGYRAIAAAFETLSEPNPPRKRRCAPDGRRSRASFSTARPRSLGAPHQRHRSVPVPPHDRRRSPSPLACEAHEQKAHVPQALHRRGEVRHAPVGLALEASPRARGGLRQPRPVSGAAWAPGAWPQTHPRPG